MGPGRVLPNGGKGGGLGQPIGSAGRASYSGGDRSGRVAPARIAFSVEGYRAPKLWPRRSHQPIACVPLTVPTSLQPISSFGFT